MEVGLSQSTSKTPIPPQLALRKRLMGAAETNGGENTGHKHILFLVPAPDDDQLIGP